MEPRQASLPRVLRAAAPKAEAAVPGTRPAAHPRAAQGPLSVLRGCPAARALISRPQPTGASHAPECAGNIHGGKTDAAARPARPVARPPRPARGRAWVGLGVGRACGPRPLSPRWACARAQWLFQGRRAGSGPPHLALVIIVLETRRCIRGTDPWLRGGPWRAWDRGHDRH